MRNQKKKQREIKKRDEKNTKNKKQYYDKTKN